MLWRGLGDGVGAESLHYESSIRQRRRVSEGLANQTDRPDIKPRFRGGYCMAQHTGLGEQAYVLACALVCIALFDGAGFNLAPGKASDTGCQAAVLRLEEGCLVDEGIHDLPLECAKLLELRLSLLNKRSVCLAKVRMLRADGLGLRFALERRFQVHIKLAIQHLFGLG